jgi:PAS domain-containing protein
MTQQIVQWKYEKRTAVNKLTPKKTEPLPSQTYTTMPNETITSVEEDTDSFQSAVSSSSEDEKRESRLQDETALPTVNVAAPDETPSPFGTSVASMPDRAGSGFLDVADHTDPSPLYPHTRQGRRSSFIKKSFHQIGDGRGHNVCAFMRDNQYVVLDLASEDMPIIAYVSKQFAALTGYDETELVGRTYDVLFGPNTNPVCIAQMRHILRSGNEGFVYFNNNCKDGTPFINIMYLVPFTPPTRQGDQQQTGKFMLGCQSNAGDSIVRLLLADITDPTVNPHPKSNLLLRFDSTTYVPNVGPGKVTSPHFDGCFFLKTLTDPHDPRVASYFEGRRRRFELQIQGEFKTPISGDVYLNLYLPEQLKLGFASRAIVKLMCAGVRKRSKGSVLTFGDEYDIGKPAMALPGSGSFDRLVISNPSAGQVPPIINVDMFPEPVEVVTKYEIGTTYSFSFHSAFLDLEYWCVRGLPGISSVSLSNITGTQTIHVALTTLPPGVAPELIQSQGIHLIDFEVIHKSLPAYASAVSGVPPPLPSDPVPPPSTTDTAPTDSAIVSPAPNTET